MAVGKYKESLIVGGKVSWNWCRCEVLKNLNMIFQNQKIFDPQMFLET